MARRLKKTLVDYLVIAISPALIMLLVGSLVFFLLTVFYQGEFTARLMFIFAMFVIAIVLIARISMEEGIGYAAMFAAPLAVATGIATMRFIEVKGVFVPLSWAFNWTLLAITWWCAHKLTWDCTLIDEKQDHSGQGLLQTMGFESELAVDDETADGKHESQRPKAARPIPEPAAEGTTGPAEDDAGNTLPAWRHWFQRKRKPHAPGVWVLYFSLAALPLFGIGQWFIPGGDAASRRFAFNTLFVYLAAALGLLVATSFLGLRRYLRQRRVDMPGDMIGVWLGAGAVLVIAVLGACALLPRPSAEYAVAQLPFEIGSPDDVRPSRFGFGNDGPQDDQMASQTRNDAEGDPSQQQAGGNREGGRQGNQSQRNQSQRNQSQQRQGNQSQGNQSQGNQGSQSQGNQSQGNQGSQSQGNQSQGNQGSQSQGNQSQGNQGSQSQGNQSQGNEGSQSQGNQSQGNQGSQSQGNQSQGNQGSQSQGNQSQGNQGSQSQGNQSQNQSQGNQESQSQGNQSQGSQGDQPQRDQSQGDNSTNSDTERSGASESGESGDQQERRTESGERNQGRGASSAESQNQEGEGSERAPQFSERAQSRQSSRSNANRSRSSSQPPTNVLQSMGQGVGMLLKLVLYALILAAVVFFGWRYRHELKEGWLRLVADLRRLWERLFGGRRSSDASDSLPAALAGPDHRPFSEYVDPFRSGLSRRTAPEELVRYSFDALEAWARDRGFPRDPEQTPLEFARIVGSRDAALARSSQVLGEMYSRLAYADGRLPASCLANLETLWQSMNRARDIPLPPPIHSAAR